MYRPLRNALWMMTLLVLILTRNPACGQTLSIPAPQLNKIIYVANALSHIDTDKTREKAAQAFYVVQQYTQYPNSDPRLVLKLLNRAQDTFDKKYRSNANYNAYRYRMVSYEVVANMLSILAAQPGNEVPISLVKEATNFATLDANGLGDPQTQYLEASAIVGNSRIAGRFQKYLNTQIENLYDLGLSNPRAQVVADVFFGSSFNAYVGNTALMTLNANPAFRDSANFRPLFLKIDPITGALNATRAQINQIIADYRARMAQVFTDNIAVLSTLTAHQKTDYSSYPASAQAVSDQAAVDARKAPNLAALQSAPAFSYVTPFTIEPDPKHQAYEQARAVLDLASKVATFAADVTEAASPAGLLESEAPAVRAVASGIDVAGAAMDVAEAFGAFGKSNDEVIMDGINQLSSQMASFQNQINGRLDIIDQNIANLYSAVNTQFAGIRDTLANISSTLAQLQSQVIGMQSSLFNLQSSLDRLTQNIYEFASQAVRQPLKNDLATIDTYVRNSLTITQSDYTGLYSRTKQYATGTVFDAAEIGTALNGRAYDDLSVKNELNSPNPEWNLNYALEFARRRFGPGRTGTDAANFSAVTALGPSGQLIANPRGWEMSVSGMIRLASQYPDLYAATTLTDTPNSNQGFFGTQLVGAQIQGAAAGTTLQTAAGGATVLSPLFPNLLKHQSLQAQRLITALQALAAETPTDLTSVVARVRTQWTTTSPTPNGINLQTAIKALSGSRSLLNTFVTFGLSRTLSSNDLLSSLLYSPQRLPDDELVKSLYDGWASGQPDPLTIFQSSQSTRQANFTALLNTILTGLFAQTAGRPAAGETVPSVEIMLRRLDPFTNVKVTMTVTPGSGQFIAGDPLLFTFRSSDAVYPVSLLPDPVSGKYSVSVPPGYYSVAIKASRFLQRVIADVNTLTGPKAISASLLVGDVFNDNRIDNRDLIALRNALGSSANSPNWNPLADLNGDGVVNMTDFNLLRTNYGRVGDP